MLIKDLGFKAKGISADSRAVKKGFVFVAVKGPDLDGHDFIPAAIKNGARVIVVESLKSKVESFHKINVIKVKDSRKALAQLAADFYGNPSGKLRAVGITGTNGKTTISYLIESILKQAGKSAGVIGTINCHFKNKVICAKNTTPGAVELQSILAQMARRSVDYALMEVSSHALDQGRVEGIKFAAAIFSNLTQDHLDYHKKMEEYFRAKALLFKGLDKSSQAIINIDDTFGARLTRLTRARVITYGMEKSADIRAEALKFNPGGVEFSLAFSNQRIPMKSRLIGRHNVYNILAAAAFCLANKLSADLVKKAFEEFQPVRGRLESVKGGWPFKVFIDYAHTEDALRNVLLSLREFAQGRIIVVFGCGGDRDKAKRPKMGAVVARLADAFIITNDNPRSEEPQDIINDIKQGIKADNYRVIPDRKQAIRESLAIAKRGDIILIAGKGHENYQLLKGVMSPFNDKEAALECLRSMRF